MRACSMTLGLSIPLLALLGACGSAPDGSKQEPGANIGPAPTDGTSVGSGSSTTGSSIDVGSAGPGSSGVTGGTGSGTSGGTAGTTTGGEGVPITSPPSAGTGGSAGAGGSSGTAPPPQAGILTAGVWDDNRNFGRFMSYRSALGMQHLAAVRSQ